MPYLLRTYSIFKLTLATLQKTELKRQAVDLDNDDRESQEKKKEV
jgi:hypothetical protein